MRAALIIATLALAATAVVASPAQKSVETQKDNVGRFGLADKHDVKLPQELGPIIPEGFGNIEILEPQGYTFWYLPVANRQKEVSDEEADRLAKIAETNFRAGCQMQGGNATFYTTPNWKSGFQAVVSCKVDVTLQVAQALNGWEENKPIAN